MAKFEPKITKARFHYNGFTTDQMLGLGQTLVDLNFARFDQGLNVSDSAAAPLSEQYARRKARLGGQPIRDLNFTGRLRRSLKPLSTNGNKVSIGPTDAVAAARLAFNQRRERQWGVSPHDKQEIVRSVADMKRASELVKTTSEAA